MTYTTIKPMLITLLILLTLFVLMGCSDSTDPKNWSKPTANAGNDQVVTLPGHQITLYGSAKSHIKIYDIDEVYWRQISGPQSVQILNADKLTATVLMPTQPGHYQFRLEVEDSGGRTDTDDVLIIVNAASAASMTRTGSKEDLVDNYHAIWQTIADHYINYPEQSEQWQSLYQEFLVKSVQAESHEQWLTEMNTLLAHLNDSELTLGKPVDEVEKAQLAWYQDNGVGYIEFGEINNQGFHSLRQLLEQAKYELSDLSEVHLVFEKSIGGDEQIALMIANVMQLAPQHIEVESRFSAHPISINHNETWTQDSHLYHVVAGNSLVGQWLASLNQGQATVLSLAPTPFELPNGDTLYLPNRHAQLF